MTPKKTSYKDKPTSSTSTTNRQLIEAELVRAFTYLGYEAVNLETYINALRNDEFANMTVEDFQKAIRNGARGVYGRTYKMCVQEVLIWAREYYKSLPLTQRTGVVEHWNKDLPTGL